MYFIVFFFLQTGYLHGSFFQWIQMCSSLKVFLNSSQFIFYVEPFIMFVVFLRIVFSRIVLFRLPPVINLLHTFSNDILVKFIFTILQCSVLLVFLNPVSVYFESFFVNQFLKNYFIQFYWWFSLLSQPLLLLLSFFSFYSIALLSVFLSLVILHVLVVSLLSFQD